MSIIIIITCHLPKNISKSRSCAKGDARGELGGYSPGAVLAGKISGGHGPTDKGEKGGLGANPQQIFLTTPFLS